MNKRQDLLNRSYKHVIEQGCASINGSMCAYRSDNGKKCGAGIFIKKYNPNMEEKSWDGLIKYPYEDHTFDQDAVDESYFVTEVLQAAHDKAAIKKSTFLKEYMLQLQNAINQWNAEKGDDVKFPSTEL